MTGSAHVLYFFWVLHLKRKAVTNLWNLLKTSLRVTENIQRLDDDVKHWTSLQFASVISNHSHSLTTNNLELSALWEQAESLQNPNRPHREGTQETPELGSWTSNPRFNFLSDWFLFSLLAEQRRQTHPTFSQLNVKLERFDSIVYAYAEWKKRWNSKTEGPGFLRCALSWGFDSLPFSFSP